MIPGKLNQSEFQMNPQNDIKLLISKRWFFIPLFIGNALFFFMLFAPRTYQNVKIPLLIFVVLMIITRMLAVQKINLHPKVNLWFLLLLIYGSIWSYIGAIQGNPGTLDSLRLNIVWVLLYALFICGIYSRDILDSLVKTIFAAAIAISLYSVYSVLYTAGFLPYTFLADLDMGDRIGINEGYIQLTAHNVGTLAFVNPFLFAAIFFSNEDRVFGFRRKWAIAVFVLTLITVLVSGRRVLWINVVLTPFVCLVLAFLLDGTSKKMAIRKSIRAIIVLYILLLISGVLLQLYTSWSIRSFCDRLFEAFDSGGVRQQQMKALLAGFTDNPIWGTGFGKGVKEVIRDPERPWNYELSYILNLYNTGIVGTLYYFSLIGWVYYQLVKLLKKNKVERRIAMPLLVGLSTFLIANATNPYYGSYDFMWTLFLPVAYINLALLRKSVNEKHLSANRA